MAISRSDYEISIKSSLDDAAIKKAQGDIEDLAKSTTQAGEALKNTGGAHDQLGDKAVESGKKELAATEKTTLGHREKREALHAVLNEFGGFSEVGLLLSAELAPLAAILTLVRALKEAIADATAEHEKLNSAIRELDVAKLTAATTAASDFAAAIGQAVSAEQTFEQNYSQGTAAMDERIKKYAAEKDAVLAVEEAKEAAYEAEIDRQVKLNLITKEAGDAAKEAAKLALDSERGAGNQAKLQNEIDERQKRLDQASHRLSSGEDARALQSNQADVVDDAKGVAAAQKALDQSGKDIEISSPDFKTKKFATLDDLQKAAQEARQTADRAAATPNTSGTQQEADYIAAGAAKQKQIADLLDKEISKRQEIIAAAQTELDEAKEAHEAAKARVTDSIARISKDNQDVATEPDSLRALRSQYATQAQRDAQVQQLHTQAAQSRLGAEGSSLPGTPAPPAPLSPEDAAAQDQWAHRGQIGGDIVDARHALGLLRMRHNQRQGIGADEMKALLNEIVGLAHDIHASAAQRYDLAQLAGQVQSLRRQLEVHEGIMNQTSSVR